MPRLSLVWVLRRYLAAEVVDLLSDCIRDSVILICNDPLACPLADAVAKRYRPWPKGLRADSLPWFDSPLVQGASRLRYTDKAQVAATGPYWPKGARNKKDPLACPLGSPSAILEQLFFFPASAFWPVWPGQSTVSVGRELYRSI